MSRPSMGGTLDLAALARLHAPRTSEEIRSAIHEMRARGMGDHEIAQASGVAVEMVRRVLAEDGDERV